MTVFVTAAAAQNEAERLRGLARQNKALCEAVAALSDESFRRIWDNPKDADYDRVLP